MNIYLRLTLNCTPDAAWNAIADPRVFRAVSSPILQVRSCEPDGFPEVWRELGPHRVALRLFGFVPLGTQTIDISFTERPGGVRMMIDSGEPKSGLLTVITSWDHRMAISSAPGGKTLYRDRLVVKAGVFTPVVWMSMWSFWQIRARKISRAARSWG